MRPREIAEVLAFRTCMTLVSLLRACGFAETSQILVAALAVAFIADRVIIAEVHSAPIRLRGRVSI